MNLREDYIGRCRGLLISLGDVLSEEDSSWVEHLIDHGEAPEAMVSLAHIVVDNNMRIPAQAIQSMRDLASDLVPDEAWPPNLDSHALIEDSPC